MLSPNLPLPPLEIQALYRSDNLYIARVAGVVEYTVFCGKRMTPRTRTNYSPVYVTDGYRTPEEAIADATKWVASNSSRSYVILPLEKLIRNIGEVRKKKGIGKRAYREPWTVPEVKAPRFPPKGNT